MKKLQWTARNPVLENLLKRIEAWGYPKPAIDWLRRHRLLTIIVLAAASWAGLLALAIALYSLMVG